MAELIAKAYAKINLGLDITGLRDDGYHLVRMVMQTVGLSDGLVFTRTGDGRITIDSDTDLGKTSDNLIYKAIDLLRKEEGIKGGMHVKLTKRIPVAAGLAGGSSDCAASLKAVNELYGLGLSPEKLAEYGVRLGADVPYCLMGGTALSEGIGEILTPLPAAPRAYVLLVKPPVGISTKEAYAAYDREERHEHPDIDGLIRAIKAGNLPAMCALMGNVLEPVSIAIHPEIADIKAKMKALGAAGSMMSGSGPTVFGLFEEEETAKRAYEIFTETRAGNEVILTSLV